MRTTLAAMLAAAVGVTALAAVTPTHIPGQPIAAYAGCAEEDGSTPGQAFPCYWDAARQGNGQGMSYVLAGPGDDILADPALHN